MVNLSGKVSLVTGASSGIGQATAIRLAQAGSDLVLHFNSNEKGIEETAKTVESNGVSCHIIQADFLESDSLASFCQAAWSWKNGLDLVVNNAGGDVLTPPKKNWTFEKKLDFLWRLDVQSTITLSRDLGQRMKSGAKASKSTLINIGWDQAPLGQAGESGQIFSTTKGAIMSFTHSLAKSLAPEVRVLCVAPGWIQTEWGQSTSEYWDQRARKESLQQRWGSAQDVAQAICLLASDESEFINGQTINVNGGFGFGCQ